MLQSFDTKYFLNPWPLDQDSESRTQKYQLDLDQE